jgi:hypothetical protein
MLDIEDIVELSECPDMTDLVSSSVLFESKSISKTDRDSLLLLSSELFDINDDALRVDIESIVVW